MEDTEYGRGFKAGYDYALFVMQAVFKTPIPEQAPEQLAVAERLKQEALDLGYFPGTR